MLLNLFYRSFFRLSIAHTFCFLLSETRQPLSGRQSILGYYTWKSCLRTTKPTAVTCRLAFFEIVVEKICKKLWKSISTKISYHVKCIVNTELIMWKPSRCGNGSNLCQETQPFLTNSNFVLYIRCIVEFVCKNIVH